MFRMGYPRAMAQDAFQEVAEAAAKRKAQIRAWAQKQIDPNVAVTEYIEPVDGYETLEEVVERQDRETKDPGPADPAYAVDSRKASDKAGDEGASEESAIGDTAEADEEDSAPVAADAPVAEDEVERPAQSDNKGEWVAYRIKTHGLTEDEANEKTKQELIDLAD
jgi:hypothetical protein